MKAVLLGTLLQRGQEVQSRSFSTKMQHRTKEQFYIGNSFTSSVLIGKQQYIRFHNKAHPWVHLRSKSINALIAAHRHLECSVHLNNNRQTRIAAQNLVRYLQLNQEAGKISTQKFQHRKLNNPVPEDFFSFRLPGPVMQDTKEDSWQQKKHAFSHSAHLTPLPPSFSNVVPWD